MSKPKIAKVASPAAISVLRQATALSPLRKKASDGLLPSAAHIKASPNSDHNTGLAVDLTKSLCLIFDGSAFPTHKLSTIGEGGSFLAVA